MQLSLESFEVDSNLIAQCAYICWESEGRPPGRELEFWLQAEALLRVMLIFNGEDWLTANQPSAEGNPNVMAA